MPAAPAAPTSCQPGNPLCDVVLDTNVVLDWLVFDEPSVEPLAAALATGQLRWIATPWMLDELAHVLARPVLARWQARLGPALAAARDTCTLVQTPPLAAPRILWCSDPQDQAFIDLALAWPARWLFSRDKALLKLARRARQQGVQVRSPSGFDAAELAPAAC